MARTFPSSQPGFGPAIRSTSRTAATTQTSFVISRHDLFHSLIVFVLTALLLLAADILLLRQQTASYRIEVGNYRDEFFLSPAYDQQVEANGTTYRWTGAEARIVLGQIGVAEQAVFTLELGGRPEPALVQLLLNDQSLTAINATLEPRRYHVLLPPNQTDPAVVSIKSPTFTAPNDNRELGVTIQGFELNPMPGAWPMPTLAHYLAQLGIMLALQITMLRLGWRWPVQALIGVMLALVLAFLLGSALLLAYPYLSTMAAATILLAGLTWLLLPHAERRLDWLGTPREIRILWAIMIIACLIRLIGMLYPTFDGQDLGRNFRRQLMSLGGQMYIFSGSAEFARGLTIYPTGPYLFLMPGIILSTDIGALIETVLTILEGATGFLIAMLVRRLGGSKEAALFGSVLFLANYASFSVHVYQFSAQIFGQWFTAPIALLLLSAAPQRPTFRHWAFAILLLMFGVYSHIGVAILGISWMGMMLLLAIRRGDTHIWKAWALFIGSVLVAALFMYLNIIAITLTHASGVVEDRIGGDFLPGATRLFWQGLNLAYTPVGVLLIPLGFILLLRARPQLDRLIVPLGLVLTVLFYIAVYMVLKLQVRYFYFALPFALTFIALVLGRLAQRGRAARLVTWLLVGIVSLQTLTLWFATTFGNGQISMTPLTH
jgi:hypothetical protein